MCSHEIGVSLGATVFSHRPGYKGHLTIDPDSEIVTATTVTAANSGDADPAEQLLAGDLPEPADRGGHSDEPPGGDAAAGTVDRSMPHSAASGDDGEVDAKNGVATTVGGIR